jgi:hypothetical protein
MNINFRSPVVISLAVLMLVLLSHYGFSQTPKSRAHLRHAEVSFVLAGDGGENKIFRKRLMDFAEAKQIRHGPIGVQLGVFGNNTYTVAITGPCEGAINDVAAAVESAASKLPDEAALVDSYHSTAKCVERGKYVPP